MVFRRIYWVVEQLQSDGTSTVKGVYTSVHDLIERGISGTTNGIRLSLFKLDAPDGSFGAWSSPSFLNLEEDLKQFVETGEFSIESCRELMGHLGSLYNSAGSV